VRYGDQVFAETVHFVDPSFFDIFTFPFLAGTNDALKEKNDLVMSRRMAEKYFGNALTTGQTVSVKFRNGKSLDFTVAAVVDQPLNNTMYFDFLAPAGKLPMGLSDRRYISSPEGGTPHRRSAAIHGPL
jgi:putative ABC transport system permease protein